MSPDEFRKRFPQASTSCIRRNQAGAEVPHPEPREHQKKLEADHAGEAQGARCVPVSFTLYRVRLLDVEAKYASVKDLLDCVVDAGYAMGDKEGQIDLKVDQVKVDSFKEERTEISITL
jgi:hypothetical protein